MDHKHTVVLGHINKWNLQSMVHILLTTGHIGEATLHFRRYSQAPQGGAREVPLHQGTLCHHVHAETMDHQTGTYCCSGLLVTYGACVWGERELSVCGSEAKGHAYMCFLIIFLTGRWVVNHWWLHNIITCTCMLFKARYGIEMERNEIEGEAGREREGEREREREREQREG